MSSSTISLSCSTPFRCQSLRVLLGAASDSLPAKRYLAISASLNPSVRPNTNNKMEESMLSQASRKLAGNGLSSKYGPKYWRSEEHTSELQSLTNIVCRLL